MLGLQHLPQRFNLSRLRCDASLELAAVTQDGVAIRLLHMLCLAI